MQKKTIEKTASVLKHLKTQGVHLMKTKKESEQLLMLPRPHHLVVSLYVVYESKELFCGFELDVEQVDGLVLGQLVRAGFDCRGVSAAAS